VWVITIPLAEGEVRRYGEKEVNYKEAIAHVAEGDWDLAYTRKASKEKESYSQESSSKEETVKKPPLEDYFSKSPKVHVSEPYEAKKGEVRACAHDIQDSTPNPVESQRCKRCAIGRRRVSVLRCEP